jgi:25S rRNA (adenine2142-N1)-methyltransferase
MLEIGALSPENIAAKRPYISNTPIDLNSQHPDILVQDFLKRPLPKTDAEKFDIVSCSLVLNFVPEPRDRGEYHLWSTSTAFLTVWYPTTPGRMLRLIHQQLLPSERSFLFMVLPTACTENSRYMTAEHMRALFRFVGFEEIKRRAKPGGKVIYTLWKWQEAKGDSRASEAQKFKKRMELRSGATRNNFVVLLD